MADGEKKSGGKYIPTMAGLVKGVISTAAFNYVVANFFPGHAAMFGLTPAPKSSSSGS